MSPSSRSPGEYLKKQASKMGGGGSKGGAKSSFASGLSPKSLSGLSGMPPPTTQSNSRSAIEGNSSLLSRSISDVMHSFDHHRT
jgi:hypothetical protein